MMFQLLLDLLCYPAYPLSHLSDLLLSFLSLLPLHLSGSLPFQSSFSLPQLIMNEADHLSIQSSLVAQQKISNLSVDPKIALHCEGDTYFFIGTFVVVVPQLGSLGHLLLKENGDDL